MEDTRAESLPIGAAEAAAALQTLQRYKAGKAALDKRLIDNELWFRMGHWKNYRDPLMPGKAQPSSGWLFNSIANKHADAMDNYPEPMVLPRAADDQATAHALSSVLPVVLEQADYEQVYSDVWWRKLKQGRRDGAAAGQTARRPVSAGEARWFLRTTSAGHVLTRIFSCTHETGKENRHEQNRKQCRKGAL